ncbi:MAG: T9SS type A sorting domain-containing protein [Ignavibacteria bacterium]|nr:T9SS type A sorting domain-containing protein [Ignavibacteria bacterium]
MQELIARGYFLSTNNGTNWTTVNNGLTSIYIGALAVSGTNIFAGTSNGGGVFLSTNNGTNWTAVNNGLTQRYIWSLAVSGTNLFAGTEGGGVYISANNGTSWTSVSNGLPVQTVNALAASETNIFAGTYPGVYLSTNNGTNWIIKNQGFNPSPQVLALLVSNNYIFAGTIAQSVSRRSYAEVIGIQNIGTEIPTNYSLSQNYPNPFNPVTNLKFGISDLGFVSLKIFDLLGKEVVTLVNDKLNPGTYRVEFDAGSLTSGVYFYRLTSGDFTDTKRMLLVK